jgi:diguanylate cyclase (GGDEF)-like protein
MLILIGASTTAWISYEAVSTHDLLRQEEDVAYEILATVNRAKVAHEQLKAHTSEVLLFDKVIAPEKIEQRFRELENALSSEINQIYKVAEKGQAQGVLTSLENFNRASFSWHRNAVIALGIEPRSSIPTHHYLNKLAERSRNAIDAIFVAAQTGAQNRSDTARAEYATRVRVMFISMLTIFCVFGGFSIGFGRRLANLLSNLSDTMDLIRQGDFSVKVTAKRSHDEIGKIANGIDAFKETLQALTDANTREKHLATHDLLTGLANRRALEEYMAEKLKGTNDQLSKIAILHIDLDRFKQVNDMLGHAAGDEILVHAARAMKKVARSDDLVARVGGDEFIVVLNDVESNAKAGEAAETLIMEIVEPINLWGEMVQVGASIGIAFASADETLPERLLGNADMALYIAKGAGRGGFAFFSNETRNEFENNMSLLRDLRFGLERGQIIPFFQPQIDAANGSIIGFEALARWEHPSRGLLGPGAFIDIAFDNGLGDRLTEVIMRQSISSLVEWRALGHDVPCVSINFAASQLRSGGLTESLDDALLVAGLHPSDIVVEILESVLLGDGVDPALSTIAQLKRSGYRIELDDFGTGHASISNLRKFKVDSIKLDRIFVTDVEKDPEQEMILRTLIDLCKNLDIDCLAEGVETEAEKSKLLALGCSRFQGFGIAKPMSREAVPDWIASFSERDRNSNERVS